MIVQLKEVSSQLDLEEKNILLRFFPQGIIALDLETTGLSPLTDRIIEFAAIKIIPEDQSIGVWSLTTFLNPEIPIPPRTTLIHGITDEMVLNAPTISSIKSDMLQFFSNLPIVAHNAKFDLGFIVNHFLKHQIPLPPQDIYCSCKLSRHTHSEFKNHKLSTLASNLNIPLLRHHRAYDDALASLKIFIHSLIRINNNHGHMTTPHLLKRHGYIFNLTQFEKLSSEEFPHELDGLEKLTREGAVIEILYTGGSYKNAFRPVKLSGLLNTPDGNVLYAKCLLSHVQKSFKLNKIKEIRKPHAHEIQKWLEASPVAIK